MPFGYSTEPIRKWRLDELLEIVDSFENELEVYVNNNDIRDVANYINIALNMCGKVIVTMREILTLCAHGYADGSMALARNIFEQFVTLAFFESKNGEEDFEAIVKDYYIDYDVQRSKAYRDYYGLQQSKEAEKYTNELNDLKKNATHSVSGVYWWTGHSNFVNLISAVYTNLDDELLKNLLSDLYFSYKRACISIHACSIGNTLRLGNDHETNIIDTAPTIEGQQYVLWFVIASVLYIFGVTSKLIGIDFQEFREKLNELCVYYLDSMKD